MKDFKIVSTIKEWKFEEMGDEDKLLIEAAKKASENSYSPYSKFAVGTAVKLANGKVLSGCNQENAAYPSGLCAERTTIFYVNANYPNTPVNVLAIAAHTENGFSEEPVPPCGACRQVILETEKRFNQPIRILLYGSKRVYDIKGIGELLPLSFDKTNMNK
jgi:cytidine deaminase